jgi:hypothetical protein
MAPKEQLPIATVANEAGNADSLNAEEGMTTSAPKEERVGPAAEGRTEEEQSDATSFFPDDAVHYNDHPHPRFKTLKTQVAGHEGVLSDQNGYVIIKPCRESEIEFYEKCLSDMPSMADCIPSFMGTLELNTPETIASMPPEIAAAVQGALPVSESRSPQQLEAKAYSPPNMTFERAVVLENLTYGYTQPCVLDLKLGSVLTADNATPEKQARLATVSQRTTSGSVGIRVAGMKVWDAQQKTYKVYDRDWGKSLTPQTLSRDALSCFFGAQIRAEEIQMIATRFLEDIQRILYVLDDLEVRIFSSSLLFVYEGDQTALDLAIEEEGKQLIRDELGDGFAKTDSASSFDMSASPPAISSPSRTASTNGDGDLPSDVASDEDEGNAARDFCICRLIDFAHAAFSQGQGRDDNLIMGLKAARTLFEDFLEREFAPQLD